MITVEVINPEELPAAAEKWTRILCELYLQYEREGRLKERKMEEIETKNQIFNV